MEKIIWEKLSTNGEIFSPRTGFIIFYVFFISFSIFLSHCAAFLENKVFIFGGSDENTRMNDFYVFNLGNFSSQKEIFFLFQISIIGQK